ncbi:MAG TPA: ATP-binding cassette domain-containing protein, partial [Chloroflexia bacterium]|nr:ATP-binding cassette domain-containing protein [Chloroflexia bacterium]
VDEGRLAQAVTVARLSNDIDQFPNGLDTVIGERGVTLSGGQKQRAAIARAVMRDPAILILDDALSSIDTQTQAEILGGLQQVLAGRTSILIAHRISTVKAADQIIVVEAGRVLEQGQHAELLARGGVYAQMYRRELLSQELDVE